MSDQMRWRLSADCPFLQVWQEELKSAGQQVKHVDFSLADGALERLNELKGIRMTHNPDKLPFGEMSDEDKAAILLAAWKGEPVEYWSDDFATWAGKSLDANLYHKVIYRLPPKPEPVQLYGDKMGFAFFRSSTDTHRLTYFTRNGEIDETIPPTIERLDK